MSDQTRTDETQNTSLYIRQGDQKDGYAEVVVSGDGTAALATFHPPAPGGSFLVYGTVALRLEEAGITSGVLHDAIQNALLKANSAHEAVRDVLIAQGIPPENEIPEHFYIRRDLLERKPEIDPALARVDWHSISPFTIVQQKEPIARRIAKTEGKPGRDIYGREIPFRVSQRDPFSAGTNVIDHPKGLFAGKSGRISIDPKGVVSVADVLHLKKGVDFTTGNITFPGDVILQGKIADGFKIYTGGSLVSNEVVDATEIVCRKDMIAQGGIEGKSKGAIRIGGTLTTRYIQNCRVAVRGDITVSGSIVQSKVYSMGTLRMGESAKLVGCECIMIGGVKAFDIGNQRGTKTWIRCGTDFTVQQELDLANEQLKQVSLKLSKAEELYKEEPGEALAALIASLRSKKAEIAARIPLFLPRIDRNDAAYVEVRGTVWPGTEIEICHVPLSILKEQRQVVFRLDKIRGKIITEPLKKG